MTDRDLPEPGPEVRALRLAAKIDPPSPFDTVRAARDLEAALDREARATSRWTPARVALVAVAAAAVGAGLTVELVEGRASAPAVAVAPVPPAPVVAPAPAVVAPPAPVDEPAATLALAPVPAAPRAPAPAPRARGWRAEADALVDAGDGAGAARVLVKALARDDAAAGPLALVGRRFPAAIDAVDDDLARLQSAEAMRLRCEQRMLRARDRRAVDACRAFAQRHPEHPGARALAFAAGRVAEDDLGDLALAEEEYSRALLLSPFVGLPSTDALLARARVRAARGDLDEARADLRLYLHNEPDAAADRDVAALVARLGLR
jgi:hypothetical protein